MEIDGSYTLQAPPEVVWNLLMDQDMLQHAIQGMERLEQTGEDTYAFTLHIKHAPLRGAYSGNAVVSKLEYPYSYYMEAEGEGVPGIFRAECNITLTALDENTVVAYQGNLHFSRTNAQFPGSLIKGIVKVLIQQFFTAIADHLRSDSYVYEYDTKTHINQVEVSHMQNGRMEASSLPDKSSFLHLVVRQLGLGDSDPFLEQQWVNRLRRIGLVSMLLFFVWVGTRLPRRARVRQDR
ncbi:MAG: CoxG family protein [Ktedonobacteraceae bacterium]